MKGLVMSIALLALASWTYADGPIEMRARDDVPAPNQETEFYCQPPSSDWINASPASTSHGSEVVDDIPDEYYCRYIDDVGFYVAEFTGGEGWATPTGIIVNFYYSECPPGQVPDVTYYFIWAEVEKELVYDSGELVVYRCKVYLPEVLHIEEDMTIGFLVDNWWGTGLPYAGFVLTDAYAVLGDCQAYFDGTYWGDPRWTPLLGIPGGEPYDIAYCLSDVMSGFTGPETDICSVSQIYPNPFSSQTTIGFTLPEREAVDLRIYDTNGRLVNTLMSERMPGGQHTTSWDGIDLNGNEAAPGLYFIRLEAGTRVATRKIVLVR